MRKKHRKELEEWFKEIRLGDKLEFIFKYTGIKWLVKKIHPNCNCESRKNLLNGEIKIKRK